ncbi:MAG: rod shape-determining protein MreC [Psychromonas sp.]|jgi:rod shape-determining protein MreC
MRKLFAFFRRFRIFLLFGVLQFIALSTYFTSLSFPSSQYFTTANSIAGAFWGVQNSVERFFHLNETNSKLLAANERLRNRLPENYIQIDNKQFSIKDTIYNRQYEYMPSTVINSTYSKSNNFLTLNIGSIQGVKRGMGVYCDQGIVGIVHKVSPHYSTVKTLLSKNINIDVLINDIGAFGLLKWETHNARFGNIAGISNDLPIDLWSKVITRGGGGIFPRGLDVGKVFSLEGIEGKAQWNVKIKFSTNFRTLQKVYVIKNLLQEEQTQLEALIPVDKEDE